MPPFRSGKATREAMPGEDGSDDERNELERKHTDTIYRALQRLMRQVAPPGTTTENITPDEAVRRYRENKSVLRDALVAMLTDGAMLGADVGRQQTEWLMGVRKAVTMVGVDWDLINEDVLSWVMGGGAMGGGFGDGYANAVTAAMATTSERQLRTLVGEWIRNDLTYRQLMDDMSRTVFSRTRAEMVATTEITRAYAEGNRAAWRRGGVIGQMRWYTAADERVCPTCGAAHGQISDVNGDFGSGLFPPAHPRCRCFIQPYVPVGERVEPVTQPPSQSVVEDRGAQLASLQQRLEVLDDISAMEEFGALRLRIDAADERDDDVLADRLREELKVYFDVIGRRRREGRVIERTELPTDLPPAAGRTFPTPDERLQYQPSKVQAAKALAKANDMIAYTAQRYGVTKKEVEEAVGKTLEQLSKNSPVAINFHSKNMNKLLQDGRYKTQFETMDSGAVLNEKSRANSEFLGLGIPENIDVQRRPVYGYLRTNPLAEEIGYGDVTFVLKDAVKRRSTITVDDSLANFAGGEVVGTPATAPGKASWDGGVEALYKYATGRHSMDDMLMAIHYLEVQMQNGVSLGDVSHIIDRKGKLTPAQVSYLDELGVKVWNSD